MATTNERYVSSAYALAAVAIGYMFFQVIDSIFGLMNYPDPIGKVGLRHLLGLGVGGLAFYILSTRKDVNEWANSVVKECLKVTWPSQKEAKAATVVVIILTLIMAALLGIFDWVFASLTSLIYS